MQRPVSNETGLCRTRAHKKIKLRMPRAMRHVAALPLCVRLLRSPEPHDRDRRTNDHECPRERCRGQTEERRRYDDESKDRVYPLLPHMVLYRGLQYG